MQRILERKFFPYVMRPGRYAGGEPGQIVKSPEGRTRHLHCYPDKYEVGQSYVGLQSLYHIVNSDDRFLCERTFTPDRDAEEVLRRENLPLFSLESYSQAREFDTFGFTLVDEMVYTNLLAVLDLAQIPLRSVDRTNDDPIILAGGPAVYNPEPIAPFVDAFFIGDGEEGILEILSTIHEMPNASRAEKLAALAKAVESVYVPSLYDDARKPMVDFAPAKVRARVITELKPEFYPEKPIVPLIETIHEHLAVEIMRGCPQGCKFCFAGPIYRPIRVRSMDEVARQVDTQLRATGYNEVSLLALSATDYPDIEPLVAKLSRRLAPERVSISLPSMRPGSISGQLLDNLKRVRKSGLTIAPEAGTERLRLVIRKDFPDEAIFDTVHVALSRGWTTIKLYFMVGLPTETRDDLEGIAKLVHRIRQISREYDQKVNINVALSPFVPQPHTPFQWDEAVAEDEIFERIKLVKRLTHANRVHVRHNSTQQAMLSTMLGRGGRELADVIETSFKAGCRFDSWGEELAFDVWMESCQKCNVDPTEYLKAIPFSQDLPWSHIDKGPSVEHLITQRQQTSLKLKDFSPRHQAEPSPDDAGQAMQFGRTRKKVASANAAAPTKNRVRIRWGKSSRLRYMSHLENMLMIERALRRARIPVVYSQGFNPVMKLSAGPPLSLGFTSEAEYLDITLDSNFMPYMIDNLKAALPEGAEIHEANAVMAKKKSFSGLLNRVTYRISADCWEVPETLPEQIERVLNLSELVVQRQSKSGIKEIDIRPAIYGIDLADRYVTMTLGLGEGGFARPTEVVESLSSHLVYPTTGLPLHRLAMYREDEDGNRVNPMEL